MISAVPRKALALAALTVFCLAAETTTAAAQGVGLGLKLGPVYPDFNTHDVNVDNRVGGQLGVFFGGNPNGVFGLQGELNWMRTRMELNGGSLNSTGKVILDYIQVPVLLRVNAGSRSNSRAALYGIVGPSFDLNVHEHIVGFVQPTVSDDEFEDFNFSMMFGGGLEMAQVLVEARYAWGLKTVNKNFRDTADLSLNSFALLFGVRFR